MRDSGYCIPSGFACGYCNGQLGRFGNCGLRRDYGDCFVGCGKLDTSGNCVNCS